MEPAGGREGVSWEGSGEGRDGGYRIHLSSLQLLQLGLLRR